MIDSPSTDARVILVETYGQHKGLDRYSKALVGPEGVMPAKMTRPLLAISQSRVLRALVFVPLRAAYSLTRLLRGRRGRAGSGVG